MVNPSRFEDFQEDKPILDDGQSVKGRPQMGERSLWNVWQVQSQVPSQACSESKEKLEDEESVAYEAARLQAVPVLLPGGDRDDTAAKGGEQLLQPSVAFVH
eukprot:COSAG05_NODE_1180_length_5597_cov_2.237541_6_plen_102_part_00